MTVFTSTGHEARPHQEIKALDSTTQPRAPSRTSWNAANNFPHWQDNEPHKNLILGLSWRESLPYRIRSVVRLGLNGPWKCSHIDSVADAEDFSKHNLNRRRDFTYFYLIFTIFRLYSNMMKIFYRINYYRYFLDCLFYIYRLNILRNLRVTRTQFWFSNYVIKDNKN